MDIHEIKSKLARDAAKIAHHLLPNGKMAGREWEVGSLCGEPGKSLKVCISGSKAGIWRDFADDAGGDLLDLWSKIRGVNLAEAIRQAKDYIGIHDPIFQTGVKKDFRRPSRPKCTEPRYDVMEYLSEERHLSLSAMTAYQVGERDREIIFPSLRGKDLIFIKYLSIDRDKSGKKVTRVEKDCEPILFGWQVIPEDARSLIITEGEIDAMSMWTLGFPAVSVPFGAGTGGKHGWVETEFHHMERFEEIFLAFDMDEEGRKAVAHLVDRLGRHRCRIVEFPLKDANECLQAGITREEMGKILQQARHLTPDELKCALEFLDEVVEGFYPPGGIEPGMRLPFQKMEGKFLCRPGELTVWTGATGSGKSQALGFTCAAALTRGSSRICIASLEMAPRTTLMRLARQISGVAKPSVEYLTAIHQYYDGRLYLCSIVGKSKVDRLIEIFEYARRRFGVDVFVVDSLMRLGVGVDNYDAQEQAIFSLTEFAVSTGVHVHLVAHARKTDTKFRKTTPGVEDIKGTSELGGNAFNVISISRDRDKEDAVRKAETNMESGSVFPDMQELMDKPSGWICVGKQRNGDWEGTVPYWFDTESLQYLNYARQKPIQYLPFSRGKSKDFSMDTSF